MQGQQNIKILRQRFAGCGAVWNGRRNSSTLNMEIERSSETLIPVYKCTVTENTGDR